ncbi:MAG TPA: hypothetical protein H9670_06105 [Firmicutes bacterium]|nr:MAG TPA: hypothetical protein [Caudoviricetes sp.]HIZ64122.1 hypothetical protein [Bacillota bacterium]
MTEEENKTEKPAPAQMPNLGKFQNVEALMRAYQELEAEFTRRSQRLKALEAAALSAADGKTDKNADGTAAEDAQTENADDALLRAVRGNEGVRTRIVGEYLASLSGVPLLAGSGAGVTAPAERATTLRQAGALALGYLKHQKHGG